MERAVEDVGDRRLLDDPARVHDRHVVGLLGDDAEVVRDEEQRHAAALPQRAEQLEDLRLDRHVERRRRLVGDQHARLARDRDRDHDALAHAAGELVRDSRARAGRAPGCRPPRGEPSRGPRPSRRPSGVVQAHGLRDLAPDGEHGIERGHRLLEHHREPGAAEPAHLGLRQRQHVAPIEQHLPAGDAAGRRTSRISESAVMLLPQPDSPTSPSTRPVSIEKGHVVDGVHAVAVQREGRSRARAPRGGHQPASGLPAASIGRTLVGGGRCEERRGDLRVQLDGVVLEPHRARRASATPHPPRAGSRPGGRRT
jgi:hypothetical protein